MARVNELESRMVLDNEEKAEYLECLKKDIEHFSIILEQYNTLTIRREFGEKLSNTFDDMLYEISRVHGGAAAAEQKLND